jgi:Lrp/AsnC family transcriptional regulator, leucine-responsive regulatory protein
MRPIALDTKDRAILRLLQLEGRLSNTELAERVHLSASACLRRVRALEESGLIASYATLLDQKGAGFDGTAFVQVTLDGQGRAALDAFEAAVKQVAQILECWLLAGQADYLLHVVYRDTTDLERMHAEIITQLPHVVRVQSTLTLRTVKKTTALPI